MMCQRQRDLRIARAFKLYVCTLARARCDGCAWMAEGGEGELPFIPEGHREIGWILSKQNGEWRCLLVESGCSFFEPHSKCVPSIMLIYVVIS